MSRANLNIFDVRRQLEVDFDDSQEGAIAKTAHLEDGTYLAMQLASSATGDTS